MNLKKNYNQRLFMGWQSIYHLKRFNWLNKCLKKYGKRKASFIELGCFDAKTLNFIPKEQLGYYLGLDANWEYGLDIAKEKYKNKENIFLKACFKPDDVPIDKKFDFGISLETLEHIPPELLLPYLKNLSSVIDGYFFITIPVERGLSLLIATTIRAINRTWEKYEFLEWMNAFWGRMERVERNQHKGFDDRLFLKQISKYFDIVKVEGIFLNTPFRNFNLSVGIIAKSKK